MDWQQDFKKIKQIQECGDRAQNPWFKEYWYNTANVLSETYLAGQPWLRTYDGEIK